MTYWPATYPAPRIPKPTAKLVLFLRSQRRVESIISDWARPAKDQKLEVSHLFRALKNYKFRSMGASLKLVCHCCGWVMVVLYK